MHIQTGVCVCLSTCPLLFVNFNGSTYRSMPDYTQKLLLCMSHIGTSWFGKRKDGFNFWSTPRRPASDRTTTCRVPHRTYDSQKTKRKNRSCDFFFYVAPPPHARARHFNTFGKTLLPFDLFAPTKETLYAHVVVPVVGSNLHSGRGRFGPTTATSTHQHAVCVPHCTWWFHETKQKIGRTKTFSCLRKHLQRRRLIREPWSRW